MKIGVKLCLDELRLLNILQDFDYIELGLKPPIRVNEVARLREIHKGDYVIHAPTEYYGLDIGSREKEKQSLKLIKASLKVADVLGASIVIIHAGTGSLQQAKKVLSKVRDERVVIENMPVRGIKGEACVGYDVESIRELIGSRFALCLDINHCVKASIELGVEPLKLLLGFLELKPVMAHVADGRFSNPVDEHLHLGEGDYDLARLLKEVKNVPRLTLETPRWDEERYVEDLKYLHLLLRSL